MILDSSSTTRVAFFGLRCLINDILLLIFSFLFHFVVTIVRLYYCDVERDCPQADGNEPAGDWGASRDSGHNVLVNKKSNTMLVFILFSNEETLCVLPLLLSRLYLSISSVGSWSSSFQSKDVPPVSVHFECWFLEFLISESKDVPPVSVHFECWFLEFPRSS